MMIIKARLVQQQSSIYLYILEEMSKIDQLRTTYLKDADLMGSKQRFGYFSIPPNASAGVTHFPQKTIVKAENGKVKTQQRNIFSGLTASGVLKKSYFSYQPSVYQGDTYVDPGKKQAKSKLEQSKKLQGKDVYKPLSLGKSPQPKAAYQHIPQNPKKKTKKEYVDENGKVITKQRNILSNSSQNIQKLKLKQIKHIPDPYQYYRVIERNEQKKSITQRGEAPFKNSSHPKAQFSTYRQTYGTDQKRNVGSKIQQKCLKLNQSVDHDATFKPSCNKKYDIFSYPQYMPGGTKQQLRTNRQENEDKSKQAFKLHAPSSSSKPSPSITTLRSNIIKCLR